MYRCLAFLLLGLTARRKGYAKRLPPGGSWQHRKVLTEGERGSDIAVKLRDADWHHHTPVFIPAPTQGYGLHVNWMLQESAKSIDAT